MKKQLAAVLLAITGLFCAQALAQPQQPVTIRADVINYDSATGISTAEGHVVITRQDGEARGESAQYNVKTDQGWLTGGVTANSGETSLSADRVWIFSRTHIAAEGSAVIAKAGDSLAASRVDYWSDREFAETGGGRPRLIQADGSVLTADYINYDMKQGVATAERDVEIDSPPRKLTAAGDRAVYTAREGGAAGDIVLTGNAWAVQDGNKIAGDKLTIKSDGGESEAAGNVNMLIMPKDSPPKGGPEQKENGGARREEKSKIQQSTGETTGESADKTAEEPVWQPPGKPQ